MEACAARGLRLNRSGKEYSGPCPLCGGEDRFHVAPGSTQPVVASCRFGHGFVELLRELFPTTARAPSHDPCHHTSRSRPCANGANPSPIAEPKRLPLHERIWNKSRPIPAQPNSPPRLWLAHRQLWRPHIPPPAGIRWRPFDILAPRPHPNSIVACYALLKDWRAAVDGSRDVAVSRGRATRLAIPLPTPGKIELIHITVDGERGRDVGGLSKRTHGSLPAAVLVLNQGWLGSRFPVHVTEGVADGLAIASRKRGSVIVTGGTSGLKGLANGPTELVRTAGSAEIWIWPDGDDPGRAAGNTLVKAVQDCGARARLLPMPDGEDPASVAPPF